MRKLTIPNGSYAPSVAFHFPRSYVYDVDIALYGDTLTGSGGVFRIHAVPPNPAYILIEFRPDWFIWNSKMYQLGDVIQKFSVIIPPSPAETPLAFTLGYWLNPATTRPGLYINWLSGPRTPEIIALPHQPSSYWSPRPLP